MQLRRLSAPAGKLSPVSYAGSAKLPSSPRALIGYLGHLYLPNIPSADREFEVIEELLVSYRMPPQLTAELYRALADILGVTIDRHGADIAGRHGIGFREVPHIAGLGADEIIINAYTYQLMGAELAGLGHLLPGATAILAPDAGLRARSAPLVRGACGSGDPIREAGVADKPRADQGGRHVMIASQPAAATPASLPLAPHGAHPHQGACGCGVAPL
jgi:hypothetical protein